MCQITQYPVFAATSARNLVHDNGKSRVVHAGVCALENSSFTMNLDAEMKRLQRKGHGLQKRQAEPLSLEEEELLWDKGLLGSANPQALVDTMLFMNGLYFALRSGDEHRQGHTYLILCCSGLTDPDFQLQGLLLCIRFYHT